MELKIFQLLELQVVEQKSPIKTMKLVKIRSSINRIEIEFRSQSFLQKQVRSMVGCLKYLGEKKWSLKKFESVLKSKKKKFVCSTSSTGRTFFSENYLLIFFC